MTSSGQEQKFNFPTDFLVIQNGNFNILADM